MKLYRMDYSCYARKTQMVLDLLGCRYEPSTSPTAIAPSWRR